MRNSSRLLHTSFALFALCALAGCPVNLDTERMPTTPPNRTDLVGTYRPTADALAYIRKDGGYAERDISLTLKADGTFELENLPDWWRTDFGHPEGGFDSGMGKWDIEKSQDWWNLSLSFSGMKRFAKPKDEGRGAGATLIGHAAPYDIAFTVGDPDSGHEMRFERVADSGGMEKVEAATPDPAAPPTQANPASAGEEQTSNHQE